MSKSVTIVGVGALGSHLALLLRNEGEIKVIDFDRVEAKNILSQFHGRPGVGKNKVQSLQQSMLMMFGLKVLGIPHKLTADNDTQILSGSDLIVDCLDNGDSRRVVQSYVRRTGTACLHGALAADGQFGQSIWDEDFKIDDGRTGAPTCEDGRHLPFIATVAAFMARSAQVFLHTGKKVGFQINPFGSARV